MRSFRSLPALALLSIGVATKITGAHSALLNGTFRQAMSFGNHAGFINAPATLFGIPRTFRAPPPPGVHPRVLFDASDFSALVSRFVANQNITGTFEEFFLDFTKEGHGPSNTLLSAFEKLDFAVSDEVLAGYVHYWGKTENGLSAQMNEESSSALIMMAFHGHVEAVRNPGQENKIFERLTKILGNWSKCILAHERLYNSYSNDMVPVPTKTDAVKDEATGLMFLGSTLWQPSYTLTQERGSGIFGLALSYDMIYNEMALIPGGLAAREMTRQAISRTLKGRISWGMDLDNRRINSNWGMYIHIYVQLYSTVCTMQMLTLFCFTSFFCYT